MIQVFEGQIISPYHPGNHVITDSIYLVSYKLYIKSLKLIRNINYNVINYILNFICI